jgi:2,3-bisphosphoglycerate-independent phosphoglycerate mutase
MKIVLLIIDGLGDEPIPAFGNKTPLEAAKTPNLDWLARNGICGLIELFFTTAIPTSEESHFVLFGYSPHVYKIQRGVFTAADAGIKLKKGDVALRGNFATVDEKLNVLDRRAGRIKKTQPFIKLLNRIKIDNIKFIVKQAGEYRVAIVLRGKGLSPNISDGDPHYSSLGKGIRKILPLDKSKKANFTAEVLNNFLVKSHQILENHSLNRKRMKLGLPLANYILVREAGSLRKIPNFNKKYNLKACCIAGKKLYKQIGRALGMDLIEVKRANGLPNTNLKGKFLAVRKALKRYNFLFLHIKATDSLAEDGNYFGKKSFIEKIDKNLKPLLRLRNVLIAVTGDHSTCSLKKRHCSRPLPILIYSDRIKADTVKAFSEKACKKGKLGKVRQLSLMPKILLYSK